jgi:hypothetical protein
MVFVVPDEHGDVSGLVGGAVEDGCTWVLAQPSTTELAQSWPSLHSVGVTNAKAGSRFGLNSVNGRTCVSQWARSSAPHR